MMSRRITIYMRKKGWGTLTAEWNFEELTVCQSFLLQLGRRADENGSFLQTRLAGITRWLESQSEVEVSPG